MYSVSIRNIENNAVPMMNPATLAPLTVRVLSRPKRISGSGCRRSQPANPASSAREAAKKPSVLPETQPFCPACVIAYTAETIRPVTTTAHGRSKVFTCASRLSVSRSGASTKADTPTGTLTKKIHSQLSASVRTPPSRTPAAAPKPPTAPHTPSAMLRSRPSTKVVDRIESAAGVMIAAPSPWTPRAPISDASDHARPAKSEASVNTTIPTRKIRRRPIRSAARPPRSRKPPKKSAYALITHWRFSCENPRSTLIEGNATFTIAMSRTTMNWTVARRPSASHFRRSEVTMTLPFPCALVGSACNIAGEACLLQVYPSQQQAPALSWGHGEALRPVLPGRSCPRARRRAVDAARRARADERAEALHRPRRAPPRDRHEHPGGAASRSRGVRRHCEADAAAAGRLARLRAHRLRARASARDAGAGALGRAFTRASHRRRRALRRVARERARHDVRTGRAVRPFRVPRRGRGRLPGRRRSPVGARRAAGRRRRGRSKIGRAH